MDLTNDHSEEETPVGHKNHNKMSKKAFLEAADNAFSTGNYYAALIYYNEVLAFDEKDPAILLKSAESARLFDSYALAAQRYSYLIDSLGIVTDSTSLFYAGEMNQRLGKFDKAVEYFDLYISQYGKDGD